MKNVIKSVLLSGILVAQATPPAPKIVVPKPIEIRELRIEGQIYEPQVLFIMDKPTIQLITIQEKRRHDFLDKIDQPLMDVVY